MATAQSDTAWSRWLRRAIDARGWNAADLARTGVVASESTISKWLNGQNPPGQVETVIEIAHVLGARDAIEALEAAGMQRSADLIREARADADRDPMIARIQAETVLSETERATMIEKYREANEATVHYFELQLAEAARRRHAERDRRTRRTGAQRAAQ